MHLPHHEALASSIRDQHTAQKRIPRSGQPRARWHNLLECAARELVALPLDEALDLLAAQLRRLEPLTDGARTGWALGEAACLAEEVIGRAARKNPRRHGASRGLLAAAQLAATDLADAAQGFSYRAVALALLTAVQPRVTCGALTDLSLEV